MDTLVPGEDGGALSAARLGWLDALLAEQHRRPTVLFLHHPPFATGIGFMDRIGLADADALKSVVARHPQIERLLSGHLHRAIQVRCAGTLASTAPSTMFQIALDLTPDGPPAFTLEPPGFQLHLWHEDTGLISHTVPVGDFAGPYRFGEG
jgi:3',5'-cyclic AMP phosphodiesterase CpdA